MVTPSLAVANVSAARARQVRAEWLASLQIGVCTISDVITYACEPSGRPLLRLSVVRLLTEQDGWTRAAAVNTVNHALRLLDQPELKPGAAAKLNLQWLVDARAGGRRILALTDAMDPKSEQPWSGFPYATPSTSGGN